MFEIQYIEVDLFVIGGSSLQSRRNSTRGRSSVCWELFKTLIFWSVIIARCSFFCATKDPRQRQRPLRKA